MTKSTGFTLGIVLGLLVCLGLTHQYGCATLPTQEQAKNSLDIATQVRDTLQVEVQREIAKAATQPANAQVQREIKTVQTALQQSEQGLAAAQGLYDLVYKQDGAKLGAQIAGSGIPYAWLAGLALTVGTTISQGMKAKALGTQLVASNGALQQYAQTTHAIADDVTVAKISSAVDSSTRAKVSELGVVKIPDAPAELLSGATLLQPVNAAGTYTVPLGAK